MLFFFFFILFNIVLKLDKLVIMNVLFSKGKTGSFLSFLRQQIPLQDRDSVDSRIRQCNNVVC